MVKRLNFLTHLTVSRSHTHATVASTVYGLFHLRSVQGINFGKFILFYTTPFHLVRASVAKEEEGCVDAFPY